MAEIKLQKRYKYAGDIMPKLLDIGFDLETASDFLNNIPDADVAPRAEVEELQAECNKWQERLKTECEYTEAITKKKVAREIFEEIDVILSEHYGKASEKTDSKLLEPLRQAERFVINEIYDGIAELKKKYMQEGQ